VCCSSDTTTPCFPTAEDFGVAGKIERNGVALSVSPAWPDASYPKSGSGTLVSVFCVPATTFGIVNTVAGLPGPAAMILPSAVRWQMQ